MWWCPEPNQGATYELPACGGDTVKYRSLLLWVFPSFQCASGSYSRHQKTSAQTPHPRISIQRMPVQTPARPARSSSPSPPSNSTPVSDLDPKYPLFRGFVSLLIDIYNVIYRRLRTICPVYLCISPCDLLASPKYAYVISVLKHQMVDGTHSEVRCRRLRAKELGAPSRDVWISSDLAPSSSIPSLLEPRNPHHLVLRSNQHLPPQSEDHNFTSYHAPCGNIIFPFSPSRSSSASQRCGAQSRIKIGGLPACGVKYTAACTPLSITHKLVASTGGAPGVDPVVVNPTQDNPARH
ncbi:hypothetical protein DFH09DRAFT_1071369 [Mycena vulgaris]|nr:hypothetical protein DFH09DRAFT_1071369 [Mycena vulgaris]